jgi:phosphatidylserine/phosphatidylglycerophosphate/cardiolipin synthase-like enzyme
MKGRNRAWLFRPTPSPAVVLVVLLAGLTVGNRLAASTSSTAHVAVYFSPGGGCTEAVVRTLEAAHTQVLVQAYSFTSAPIAEALTDARKRGVKVMAVLDKSNQTDKYSAAKHSGINSAVKCSNHENANEIR